MDLDHLRKLVTAAIQEAETTNDSGPAYKAMLVYVVSFVEHAEDAHLARAELADLRATFYGEAERIAPDLAESERRGSAWWYAAWKVGNRIRAELAVAAERSKVRVLELETELAKERERTAGMLGATPVLPSLAITEAEAQLAWQGLSIWASDDNDAPVKEIEALRDRLVAFGIRTRP